MKVLALLFVAFTALAVVAWPLWQSVYRPWALRIPHGDAEVVRQNRLTALEALRDLATDFKMGKLSEPDYRALAAPLQQQARQAMQTQVASNHTAAPAALADLDALLETKILDARRKQNSGFATNFCPQCGEQVAANFHFCASCGAKLPTSDEVSEDSNGHAQPLPQLDMIELGNPADNTVINGNTEAEQASARAAVPRPSGRTNRSDIVTQPIESSSPPKRSLSRWWGVGAVVWHRLDNRCHLAICEWSFRPIRSGTDCDIVDPAALHASHNRFSFGRGLFKWNPTLSGWPGLDRGSVT